jgi:hypothetical protein
MPVQPDIRQKLTFGSIVLNTVYNAFLLLTLLMISISLNTYEWIQTDVDLMKSAGLYPETSQPGFKKVSCGLGTYCIDAAGSVSECSLPWPQYGDDNNNRAGRHWLMLMFPNFLSSEMPIGRWAAAGNLMIAGWLFIFAAWVYSFFACFGCFKKKYQKWFTNGVVLGGLLCLIALLCFGAGFGELAVDKCREEGATDAECKTWFVQLPSVASKQPGDETVQCKICPNDVAAFTMSTACEFGWGGMIAVAACLMALFSSCCGYAVDSRRAKRTADGQGIIA